MRRTFGVAIALVILLGLPAIVSGAIIQETDTYYCTHTVGNHYCLFEDAGEAGDNLVNNGTIHDLGTITHTLPGQCSATIHFQDDWNDCVSSVRVWLASGYRLCLYRDSQQNGLIQSVTGPKTDYRFNMAENDALSSVAIYASSC